jgi:hypothetical protein
VLAECGVSVSYSRWYKLLRFKAFPKVHSFKLWGRYIAKCVCRARTRLLVGKPEGKRPLGRPRRRWMDNIKIDLLEIGLSVVDWIGLAQDRYRRRALVNSVMNLRVP